ncbi:hypothetical protein GUITHDRAFT_111926 [Guillardia theta CCMP2712]|uniref:Poly [ADP-ribose] polymerase n=1 Tax=Guillardia theta (strain CCMP2712) TaxID=905079 RepID=L1J1Q8_GUITC|nr:hypothetical protein GUITHDRAFT_111926 [Guillardia theta CCMP2712]EKX42074.1 hypothetical protein GUITHDRAFT_111926 [Guillardia theta CCMP2712]|eukprot:XP_005829054.1 hypothetical protein GUITHDRAFT_111926 [Guillardia theta CCMP2712]
MVFKAIFAVSLLAAGAYTIANALTASSNSFKKTKRRKSSKETKTKKTKKTRKSKIGSSSSFSEAFMGTNSSSLQSTHSVSCNYDSGVDLSFSHTSANPTLSSNIKKKRKTPTDNDCTRKQASNEAYWEFNLYGDEWERMDPSIIRDLERAFSSGQSTLQTCFENPRVQTFNTYQFDLSSLEQINVDTGYRRKIRRVAPPRKSAKRKALESEDTDRRHWVTKSKRSKKSESFLYRVAEDSSEFQELVKIFNSSCPQNFRRILNIMRVENKYLHDRYILAKKSIKSKHGSQWNESSMVRKLFHGTKHAAIPSIIQGVDAGFKPLLSGSRTGDIYGKGSYFSSRANYSDTYTESLNGIKKLIVADVVVGSICLGHRQMDLLPLRCDDKRYDCAVDNIANPTIFVIQVITLSLEFTSQRSTQLFVIVACSLFVFPS